MTSGQSPLLPPELLKNPSIMSLFAQQFGDISTASDDQAGEQSAQQAFQARLIQTVIEEKLKNEILLTTVMINSRIIELQNQLVLQSQGGPIADRKPEPTILLKQEETPNTSDMRNDKDNPTAEDSEFKKPSASKKIKNETKNIPKNYGKAIISFIERNEKLVRRVLHIADTNDYNSFMNTIRQKKRKVNSIADLRSLWVDEENPFAKTTRILSGIFLKRHSLSYIFNSRVTNFQGHIKYRYRLIEALREPKQFTSIKMF